MNCPANTRHHVRAFIFWLFISPRFFTRPPPPKDAKNKKVQKRTQFFLLFSKSGVFSFRKANVFHWTKRIGKYTA